MRDTGQGIARRFLPHIFDRFSQADASLTRKHRGLGLGLALVKFLVEQHGGTIRAESEGEGRGATFTVSLPMAAVRQPEGTPRLAHRGVQLAPRASRCSWSTTRRTHARWSTASWRTARPRSPSPARPVEALARLPKSRGPT